MFMSKGRRFALRVCATTFVVAALATPVQAEEKYPELGRTVFESEITAWDRDVRFDGDGLPPGQGTYAEGKVLYQEQCASCHGEDLKGVAALGRGPLIGPGLTVTQHYPYAPTLFDFTRRAMPFDAPNSLSDNEVYALCAFILGSDGLHAQDKVMNAEVLAGLEMPYRDKFVPDPRPDVK